jgi:hypothetical protein
MLFEQDQDKFFNFIHTVGIQNFDKIKKFILSISPELENKTQYLEIKFKANTIESKNWINLYFESLSDNIISTNIYTLQKIFEESIKNQGTLEYVIKSFLTYNQKYLFKLNSTQFEFLVDNYDFSKKNSNNILELYLDNMIKQQINLSEKTITKLINNINPIDTTLLESIIESSNQTNGIKLTEEQLDLLFDIYKSLLTSDFLKTIKSPFNLNNAILNHFELSLTKNFLTIDQVLLLLTDKANNTNYFDMTPYQNNQELLLKTLQYQLHILCDPTNNIFIDFIIHTLQEQNLDKVKDFILSISPELENRLQSLNEQIQTKIRYNKVNPQEKSTPLDLREIMRKADPDELLASLRRNLEILSPKTQAQKEEEAKKEEAQKEEEAKKEEAKKEERKRSVEDKITELREIMRKADPDELLARLRRNASGE